MYHAVGNGWLADRIAGLAAWGRPSKPQDCNAGLNYDLATHASLLIAKVAIPRDVMEWTGSLDLCITMERYAYLFEPQGRTRTGPGMTHRPRAGSSNDSRMRTACSCQMPSDLAIHHAKRVERQPCEGPAGDDAARRGATSSPLSCAASASGSVLPRHSSSSVARQPFDSECAAPEAAWDGAKAWDDWRGRRAMMVA